MSSRTNKFKLSTYQKRKEYIYLLWPRDLELRNMKIFKIGRTYDFDARLNKYPDNSIVYRVIRVLNCHVAEKALIDTFCLNFKRRKDIGREYYQGDVTQMMDCMYELAETIEQIVEDADIREDVVRTYGKKHRIYWDGEIIDGTG